MSAATDDHRSTHRAFLVRSPESGEIVHVHHEIIFGDRPPDGRDPRERAADLAAELAGARGRSGRTEEVDPADVPVPEFRAPETGPPAS
ncbi:hypothetical protein [Plantactinospora sp. GCM10030261]|uniref:hypothetical protein n=1 Tax=Plantactinospora sp. GCM10030261 TaxID=3273420 RepID=UPI00360C005B